LTAKKYDRKEFLPYFCLKSPVLKKSVCIVLLLIAGFISCETINLFEKNVAIPGHAWDAAYKPEFSFDITDTTSFYNIFFVIRHTDAYGFNNIWVKATSMAPGDTTSNAERFDFLLASQDRWLGSAMDDIYEHRILFYKQPVKFRRSGSYKVKLEQVMRENPLKHVMNVGLRVEKVKS
jgi:gliding motility-associated lipoprotein GldH